ncbi:MAG: glutaredoxin [Thiobacillus sp. SCN 64-317]|nr:glutathione S-transferase N-terminal domain-containing protein [Thiobacillus sp.]ODV14395.1 MAG: glutaredoxin [Thiobacillus sp. SCN 64-317]
MKPLIRLFFRTLRLLLAPFMLAGYWLTRPKGIVRSAAAQQAVDARTRNLALYHYPACPFCLKTRRTIRRLSLDIELRDAQHAGPHRDALIAGGGKPQVPCLAITDAHGRVTWLYESDDINAYLDREFGTA